MKAALHYFRSENPPVLGLCVFENLHLLRLGVDGEHSVNIFT